MRAKARADAEAVRQAEEKKGGKKKTTKNKKSSVKDKEKETAP